MIKLKVKLLRKNAKAPFKAHKTDAGLDCFISAFFLIDEKNKKLIEMHKDDDKFSITEDKSKPLYDVVSLLSLNRIACGLGFAGEIPEGYYFQVVPRSGLALWNGITIANTPGTIDPEYRDEWKAIVVNISDKNDVVLHLGDKICQIIPQKIEDATVEEVNALSETERGKGGFGSTGK